MLKYITLGIVQGLTEFLPVSSSGHLALLENIFHMQKEAVAITVIMHIGTLLAVIIFFFKEILGILKNLRMFWLILLVTLITGLIGLSGKDFFEQLFASPKFIALSLIITGLILFITQMVKNNRRLDLSTKDAIILGAAQGIAIIPGISRSGITISTLLMRGIDREVSFNFSFLVSIPAVLGATLLEAKDIGSVFATSSLELMAGLFASFITGLVSLRILKGIIKKARFHYFGYYCFVVSILVLIFIK